MVADQQALAAQSLEELEVFVNPGPESIGAALDGRRFRARFNMKVVHALLWLSRVGCATEGFAIPMPTGCGAVGKP